jgi:hypothetical protein
MTRCSRPVRRGRARCPECAPRLSTSPEAARDAAARDRALAPRTSTAPRWCRLPRLCSSLDRGASRAFLSRTRGVPQTHRCAASGFEPAGRRARIPGLTSRAVAAGSKGSTPGEQELLGAARGATRTRFGAWSSLFARICTRTANGQARDRPRRGLCSGGRARAANSAAATAGWSVGRRPDPRQRPEGASGARARAAARQSGSSALRAAGSGSRSWARTRTGRTWWTRAAVGRARAEHRALGAVTGGASIWSQRQ